MQDRLIIGIDCAKDESHTCLTICRKTVRGYTLINEFYDEEAEEIYEKLVKIERKESK